MIKRLVGSLDSVICSLLIALLTTLSTNLFAYELKPHTASYTANIKKGVSINGKAVRSLSKTKNNQWLYSFQVRSFAADIDESVVFNLLGDQVKPTSYSYKLAPFFGRDRRRSLQFDWLSKNVISTSKKSPWTLSNLPDNTYDRLSYQMQLLIDVDLKKMPVIYNIAHKGRIKPSNFDLLETVNITTALGQTRAHLIKKIRNNNSKRETHLWLSVEQPFLLLKMVQREKDGEEYEINISDASIDGKPISFKSAN